MPRMKTNGAPSNFHMVLRSHVKKKEVRSIATLPEDIIFRILLLLPADILYSLMRYVCRQWYMIICDPVFVGTHLRQSTSSLLLRSFTNVVQLFHVRERDIELSDFTHQFPGQVLSACNGLILTCETSSRNTTLYHIANPVTNRMLTLPLVSLRVRWSFLAYASSTNAYKVVLIFYDDKNSFRTIERACAILTVGVDKEWRRLDCDNRAQYHFKFYPIMSRGMMYWASDKSPCILTMNIGTENIKFIPSPAKVYQRESKFQWFLPMRNNSISFFHLCSDFSLEVWVLKDCRSGEWVKLLDLRARVIRKEVENVLPPRLWIFIYTEKTLVPLSWLNNDEKILFKTVVGDPHYFVYDVKTESTLPFTMEYFSVMMPHANSLAWV